MLMITCQCDHKFVFHCNLHHRLANIFPFEILQAAILKIILTGSLLELQLCEEQGYLPLFTAKYWIWEKVSIIRSHCLTYWNVWGENPYHFDWSLVKFDPLFIFKQTLAKAGNNVWWGDCFISVSFVSDWSDWSWCILFVFSPLFPPSVPARSLPLQLVSFEASLALPLNLYSIPQFKFWWQKPFCFDWKLLANK